MSSPQNLFEGNLASQRRLALPTCGLGNRRSVLVSYWDIEMKEEERSGLEPPQPSHSQSRVGTPIPDVRSRFSIKWRGIRVLPPGRKLDRLT